MNQSKEPTKEQEQWFWEKCGLDIRNGGQGTIYWYAPEGVVYRHLPPIDLNNLFKYAVPIVDEHSAPALEWVMGEFCQAVFQNINPTLALFWACFRAFGGEE